jgi:hypothetical protein
LNEVESVNAMEGSDRIILDKAYDTREAGELMGGLHPNDVNRLIERGAIQGRLRAVRGGRGRTVILGAEIKRYNESLPVKPVKRSDGTAVTAAPLAPVTKTKRSRRSNVRLSAIPSWK